MIDWAALWGRAARQERHVRRQFEQHEINLKRLLWTEREKRLALVNAMTDILMDIAYDEDDPSQEYCNVCHKGLGEEDGHRDGCGYLEALTALRDATRTD